MNQVKSKAQRYRYKDYLTWSDDEKWEIIDGYAYNMTPAPRTRHQIIIGKLFRKLVDKVEEKDCILFIAPTDVVLDEYNVVQPDLFLVCDKLKITEDNIRGAPDLIIEVTSPATSIKDKREKKDIYERFGVKEYLIVYPEDELVERFVLEGDKFVGPDIFNWDETMRIEGLGLDVFLWEIFEKQLEGKEEVNEPV